MYEVDIPLEFHTKINHYHHTALHNSSSIDKLTSLVNKLNMKLDRQEVQYRPAIYQNRGRGCGQRQIAMKTEKGPTAEIEINPITEVGTLSLQ